MMNTSNLIVVSLGTNQGNRLKNLEEARESLRPLLGDFKASQIVESKAVDYLDQPDFLNQILEFNINPNNLTPHQVLHHLLAIETRLGRVRDIDKGPRIIDLDLLFYSEQKINTQDLQLPHPRLFERSFIVHPLKTLPCFEFLKTKFSFPENFNNSCTAYN